MSLLRLAWFYALIDLLISIKVILVEIRVMMTAKDETLYLYSLKRSIYEYINMIIQN